MDNHGNGIDYLSGETLIEPKLTPIRDGMAEIQADIYRKMILGVDLADEKEMKDEKV